MNNSLKPCDDRLEDLSLHAAGCLTESESRQLMEHVTTCAGCHERFDEMQNLTTSLRSVKPAVDTSHLLKIEQNFPRVQPSVHWSRRGVAAGLISSLLVAATILVLVGLLNPFSSHDQPPSVVRTVDVIPASPSQIGTEDFVSPSMPTLIALRRAAVESDESLDKLLTQYSEHIFSDSPRSQSLWQGSVQ